MKKNPKDYTIIPVKCARSKELFGIRGIRQDGLWHFTWAFKMTERQAKGEHIENNTLSGEAMFDKTYPNCPHCGNDSIVICGDCGRVSCSSTALKNEDKATCAWCGATLNIVETNDISGTKGGAF